MQTVRGQSAFVSCLATVLIVAFSGCAVGGKSFSIDRNSRVPFLGLELKERKPKDALPSYRSISKSESDQSRFQSALQSGSTGTGFGLKQKDSRPAGLLVTAMNDSESAFPERVTKTAHLPPVESRPLPLKEACPTSEPLDRTSVILDFQ